LVDPEVVRRRLREIDRRVAALREIAAVDLDEFLRRSDIQAQAERHLQVGIQAAIDVALHLLAEDTATTPESYGAAFVEVGQRQVIPEALAERLRAAAGLRNVLVHAYVEVNARTVWQHLSELEDLVHFAGHIESYLVERTGGA
jgi:uncharacterized protein YutE (UPF0331/DUF86 family)